MIRSVVWCGLASEDGEERKGKRSGQQRRAATHCTVSTHSQYRWTAQSYQLQRDKYSSALSLSVQQHSNYYQLSSISAPLTRLGTDTLTVACLHHHHHTALHYTAALRCTGCACLTASSCHLTAARLLLLSLTR